MDNDRSSAYSFAVGFSDMLRGIPGLDVAQRALIVRAVTDGTPGLRGIAGRRFRDDWIRELARLYHGTTSGIAKALADELADYASRSFARDQRAGKPSRRDQRRELQFLILTSADGCAPSWRSIVDILEAA
jgi:hypothetical protein